jgi:hypothetical protein
MTIHIRTTYAYVYEYTEYDIHEVDTIKNNNNNKKRRGKKYALYGGEQNAKKTSIG